MIMLKEEFFRDYKNIGLEGVVSDIKLYEDSIEGLGISLLKTKSPIRIKSIKKDIETTRIYFSWLLQIKNLKLRERRG